MIGLEQHEYGHGFGDGYPSITQVDVRIPGLMPAVHNSEGRIIQPSNLEDLAQQARAIFAERPWYRSLLSDVRQHRKSAVFVATLGGITIFAAAVAGFEFGVRHGQDLRYLSKILKRKRPKDR